ncbi:hypothetical protein [Streptomyces endophyticus]|uniref:Uncharacterized protein n=1 Tax=Streptomyces endophyticus TaxID=714166 RepID=A0ABU6FBN9_9ACTN|nr:hypothetical protein [Streptomyces endophyticus]MEB8340261.1 hypothetical protein [Streptomyces endophyticus]
MQPLDLPWSAPAACSVPESPRSAAPSPSCGSGVGALLVARRHIDLCHCASACCRR